MVPDRFATQLPAESEVLHDYDSRKLVRIPEGIQGAIDQRYASLLEDTRYLNYRAWRGRAGGNDPAKLPDLNNAYIVIGLIGPLDSQWRSRIESHGLTIVDHVNPYGLLVRGSSDAVQSAASSVLTSRDYPVITHALPLPDSSRYGADVAEWLKSRSNPEDIGFRVDDGQGLIRVVFHEDVDFSQGHSLVSDYVEAGPEFVSGGPSGQYRASASMLSTLLEQVPEVAYVHGVYPRELHNNIGPLEHITNIEPVWTDLGYIGTGLIAGINDSGVDESHADFPAGTILATEGAMSGTDNGHGTHVSGTVAGRGAAPSPTNTSSCGDVSTPLPDARGMAHGAQIVHNNLFDGGVTDEAAMMQWQFQQGAVINNNSWGYGGLFGPVTTYDAETVAVDAAVREADPGVDSQMAIVFSAGNSAASGVSKPANGKNVITVGASQNDRCGSYVPSQCAGPDIDGMACFSSQGPSQGRNKPDIVAPGADVLSTGSSDPNATWGGWDQAWTGEEYALLPGTSMSAPMVTGAAVVFMEAYQDLNGDLPSPALVKAALINTATDMDGSGFPSNIQGWGRLNLRKAIEGPVEDGIKFFDQDEVDHLSTGESWMTEIGVASADEPVRFSLVWTDPPGSAGCDPCHINDLDLIVTAPDGTVYRGNQFTGAWSEPDASGRDDGNNVENVYVEAPVSGNWQVEIDGFNVAVNPGDLTGQDFALVATGDFGGITVDPDTVDACTADGSTDFTVTLTNQFEGTTNLAASGLPSGTSGSFDPNPVVFPDVTSIYTLSDLGLATGGAYQFEITATDDTDTEITASATVDLTLYEAIADQIVLLTPADLLTNVDLRPEFTWEAADAAEYQLQLATDAGFTSIVYDVVVEGTSFIPDADLATGTDFFWRVRGDNACGVGTWSNVFEFQTRFEPIIGVAPESMTIELAPDASDNDILSISNTGTGDLLWEINTDSLESAGLELQAHDPALDEAFDLPGFTVEGSTSPVSVEFTVDGGVLTRGDVTGFSFIGTASGVTGSSSWASDTCMVLEAPDGTTFGVGGLSGSDAECDVNDWDFQGSGSSDDGTYDSSHDDVFVPPVPDEGEWTIRFLNDWSSTSAGDITWSDVTVTLHKQPLPVCIEGEMTTVPWLSASPVSGTTASGATDDVTVTVDSTGLTHGEYEGFLCVGSNSADGQTMIPVPVIANVVDPTVGVLEGTVTTTGYCQADPGPVADALVSIVGVSNTYEVSTDESGFYSIEISNNENPVDITVSSEGYLDGTATGVNIISGDVVVEDFVLQTDSACAEITPANFDFEVILGNTDSDLLNISNANGDVDLDWSVDSFEGAGDAATQNERIVVLEEDFSETTFPPTGWSHFLVSGTTSEQWHRTTTQSHSGPASATRGDVSGDQDDWLVTPSINLPANAQLSFHDRGNFMSFYGKNSVLASTGSCDPNDGEFVELLEVADTLEDTWRSEPVVVDLSAYANEDVCLAFRYEGDFAHEWWIDTIVVSEVPPSCENPNNVPWLTLTPTAGTTIPGTSDDVTVGVDTTGLEDGVYESTICVNTSDASVELTEIPVSMTVNDPELATFTGTVTGQVCGEAPEPLGGATVSIDGVTNVATTETDENGDYFIKVHQDESPADVTVSADGYVSQTTAGVSFVGLDVIEQDYNLAFDSACLDIDPDALSATTGLDSTVDLLVDIGNLGSQTLNWDIVAEAMSMADIRAARDPENAAKLRQSDEPLIGFNFTTSASSTADPQNWNRVSDGEGLLEDVQDDTGAATSVDIEWGGLTSDGLIFLSTDNVAGDAVPQFDYDLSGMSGYGFRSGGHFFIELSGLDPNADYEYWFVGYRSTSSIDNLVRVSDGDTINAFEFNQFIDSGDNDGRFVINDLVSEDTQAFNDLSFVTRSSSTGTLRFEWEGDTQTTVIGALAIRQATDCNIPDWLSLNPMTGSVDSGAPPDTLTATLDPTGLAPGVYEGNFCVESNDPVTPLVEVPVTMTTELPPDWGAITGNVTSLGHCQANEVSLEGATVEVVGSLDTYTVETDENGFYEIYLPEGESPLTITASADNHLSDSTTVNFIGGDAVTADIDLLLEEPCASVQPEGLSIDLDADDQTTGLIELSNALGHGTLSWQIDTALPTDLQTEPTGEAPRHGADTSEAAVSLNELLDIEPRSMSVTQPFEKVIDCDSASGLIINEDGSVENGYSGNLATVSEVEFVDYYEPLEYPANLQSLCVSMVRLAGGPTSRDVELVVYADDGPGGTPGTLIGSMSATVDNIPEWPISTPVWASFDITPMGVSIASGGVYVGVGYEPADPNVFVAADESTDNPVAHAGGYWWNDSAGDWIPIEDSWADYRALFVRVQQGVIDCNNPVGVPWLSVDPSFGIVNAGQTREIDVTLDATGLAPGNYEAGLCIFSNDPVNDVLTVPVNLNVRVPTDWATIEGTVESLGYCGENPGALEGATVDVVGTSDTYTAQTDASGAYLIALPATEAPADVTASHPDHLADTQADVAFSAGGTVEVNFGLTEAAGCTSHDPDSYDVTLVTGNNTSEMLTLNNAGAGDASFDITSAEQAQTAMVELQRQGSQARSLGEDSRAQTLTERPASERVVEVTTRAELTALVVSPDGEVGTAPVPPNNLVDALNSFPDVTADLYTGLIADITVADMEPYDVVLTTNNNRWTDAGGAVSVGDALADYVDQGGKVVLFNFVFDWFGFELGGRYIDDAYGPFDMATADAATGTFSMDILDPSHPIFEGVNTLSSDTIRINMQPQPGAELIAEWSDGEALIAHNEYAVAFNALYSFDGADAWSGDLDLMAYNAVQFIAGGATGDPAPWLSFAPETGTVPADDSDDVSVTFDAAGLAAGTYMADILVNLDEGGEDGTTLSIPATMQVLDPAVIDVNPTSLTAVLEDGDTDLQSFNVANSGEATLDWSIDDTTAGCELPGWASVNPVSGSVDSGNGEDVDVTFDATGLEAGVYDATVCVDSNDPANPVVEVDLQLTVDETLSTVQGTVMSLGYCSDNPSAAGGAGILIEGQSGTYSGSADGSGFYQIDVPADETPVDVSASHGGHITGMVSGVGLVAGEASTVDIDLVLEAACADITPSALNFTMAEGDASESLNIDNSGGAASLNWTLESGTGCYDAVVDIWLTLSSSGDTVGAGSSQAVDVTANAAGMETGQHTTQLCISTDDGEADQFSIPVELNVQGEVIFHDRFEMGDMDG